MRKFNSLYLILGCLGMFCIILTLYRNDNDNSQLKDSTHIVIIDSSQLPKNWKQEALYFQKSSPYIDSIRVHFLGYNEKYLVDIFGIPDQLEGNKSESQIYFLGFEVLDKANKKYHAFEAGIDNGIVTSISEVNYNNYQKNYNRIEKSGD